jgi:SagB-type dehydrogenase family enzyme
VALPWPWPGPADADLRLAAELLLPYAPSRFRYYTAAGLAAMTGVSAGPRQHGQPAWSGLCRPVPSGGAYFPAEAYLGWTGSPRLGPGLYHYDAVHHALEQVREGNTFDRPVLLLTCRVWKNAQKYGNFGYRLGCVDVGVLVGQVLGAGRRASLLLDVAGADRLLGLDSTVESSYAMVVADGPDPLASTAVEAGTLADRGLDLDRQLVPLVHPDTVALHRAASAAPPVTGTGAPGGAVLAVLPWLSRGGSAADFQPGRLCRDQLVTVLAAAAKPALTDVTAAPLSLWCVVTAADGVAPGAYRFDDGRLVPCGVADAACRLMDVVPNLDPRMLFGGASVFVVGGYDAGVADVGARWYRVVNMLAGMAVQRVYRAAAAEGLGARACLGYDAPRVDALLGLPSDQTALAQVLVGTPAPRPGLVDLRLR